MKLGTRAVLLSLLGGCLDLDSLQTGIKCDGATPCPPASPAEMGRTDLMPSIARGCSSGIGHKVGEAFACPGTFGGGMRASDLCAKDYSLCQSAAKVDKTACKSLSGFFAAGLYVKKTAGVFSCGVSNQMPYLAGCGTNERGTVADIPESESCAGFVQAIDCIADAEWMCVNSGIDASTQGDPNDGVLCCPED